MNGWTFFLIFTFGVAWFLGKVCSRTRFPKFINSRQMKIYFTLNRAHHLKFFSVSTRIPLCFYFFRFISQIPFIEMLLKSRGVTVLWRAKQFHYSLKLSFKGRKEWKKISDPYFVDLQIEPFIILCLKTPRYCDWTFRNFSFNNIINRYWIGLRTLFYALDKKCFLNLLN